MGGRLDTIQTAILLAKLPCYKNEIKMRQKIARAYTKGLNQFFLTPKIKEERSSV